MAVADELELTDPLAVDDCIEVTVGLVLDVDVKDGMELVVGSAEALAVTDPHEEDEDVADGVDEYVPIWGSIEGNALLLAEPEPLALPDTVEVYEDT